MGHEFRAQRGLTAVLFIQIVDEHQMALGQARAQPGPCDERRQRHRHESTESRFPGNQIQPRHQPGAGRGPYVHLPPTARTACIQQFDHFRRGSPGRQHDPSRQLLAPRARTRRRETTGGAMFRDLLAPLTGLPAPTCPFVDVEHGHSPLLP